MKSPEKSDSADDEEEEPAVDNTVMTLTHPRGLILAGDFCFRVKHKTKMSSENVCRFGFNTAYLNPTGT